jgi:hypothetical protein
MLLFFPFRPLPQILYTNVTYLVWNPWLILISQLHTKIGAVHFCNKARNVSLMFFNNKLATDITKTAWRVHTTTTWQVQSTTQCKIKLRLKNERALTVSLEHEDVLTHRLLISFLLPCECKKLPLRALITYTPLTHEENTFCTNAYWINNCDSIEPFYICIQYELYILIQYENLILWKRGTW